MQKNMSNLAPKLGLLLLAIGLVVLAYINDLHEMLTLSSLQSISVTLKNYVIVLS